jgi:HK97 family phage portal protein
MAGPGLLERFAIKAARLAFPRSFGGWGTWQGSLRGRPHYRDGSGNAWLTSGNTGDFDYAASAGDPATNSAAALCLGWISDNFSEPRLEVVRQAEDGTWKPEPKHALPSLLDSPNPVDDADALWAATVTDYLGHGNAYWVKRRGRGGQVVELQWRPHWELRPESNDRFRLVTHYVHTVEGNETTLPVEDVIHFRYGKDPSNQRLGCSRLRWVLREVASDNEISLYIAAILHNMGIVGGMLCNADENVDLTVEDAQQIETRFNDKFRGAGRGRLFVPNFKATWHDIGRTPEEMAADKIGQRGEARICGALKVPAMVVGLNVGENTRTFSNYGEAREAAYEDCLIPLQRRFTSALTRFLLPDFGAAEGLRCRFNYEEVRVLQPDMDKESGRATREWQADGMTLNEYREKLGEKPVSGEEGKRYYTLHMEILKGEARPEPPPVPPGMAQPGNGQETPESQGDRAARLNGQNGNGQGQNGNREAARVGVKSGAGEPEGMDEEAAKASGVRFIPKGADAPVDAPPAEEIGEAEVDAALREWDRVMPERFRGLLEAEATDE